MDNKKGNSEREFDFLSYRNSSEEPQAYFADDLISIYTAFRDNVYSPQSVLYPSSGFDGSPAKVFGNVTFVDIENGNEGCVRELQKAGLNAIKQDIRTYAPKEPHDLLILLNPSIPTEWASRHVKSQGFILANDYHDNASEMYQNPDTFTLWGTIDFVEEDRTKGDNTVRVSRDIEHLFQPVKDATEFQELRPDDFNYTKDMVLSLIKQRIVKADENATFEQKWSAYREFMQEGMPYKRVAERYIFVKK